MKALFVAADAGARDTLQAVARPCGQVVTSVCPHGWAAQIARAQCRLIVVGTSDSAAGRSNEGEARRAGRDAGLPIAAVEDFPGNYTHTEGDEATVLVVESTAARDIARSRLGAQCPRIEVFAPARYDAYRAQMSSLRGATSKRWANRDTSQPADALWAGQPETNDAIRTLSVLLPALRAIGARLLFKAHPRDPGYAAGAYEALFDDCGVVVTDVTGLDVPGALARAPRLVLTQFSSVAIEAGFFGIPSLWLLLPDAGGARLIQKKGYAIPPLISAGAAPLVSESAHVCAALERALLDDASRAESIRRFDEYFDAGKLAAPRLVERLRHMAGT